MGDQNEFEDDVIEPGMYIAGNSHTGDDVR